MKIIQSMSILPLAYRLAFLSLFSVLLFNCQKATTESASGHSNNNGQLAEKENSDGAIPLSKCQIFSSTLCGEFGNDSAECSSLQVAAKLMSPDACDVAMNDIDYSRKQYKNLRKQCVTLIDKLCADLGPETETCKMVSGATKNFPSDRCATMLKQYDVVLADLKRREDANKPLTSEKIKAISKAGAPSFGSKKAKVTIVEFSDFECPYCSKAASVASKLKKSHGDKIRFIFRQFPLSFHKNAQVAAEASLAANAQGKFWEYHDLMFENQKSLDRSSLEKYAKDSGLNVKKFKEALEKKTYEAAVKADIKLGETVAVSGTPSMFLNGQRITNPMDYDSVVKLIDAELKKN